MKIEGGIVNIVKKMDIREFREAGFLQEVNRLFFHPHGLALEVVIQDDEGTEVLGGIWDAREDPEGMIYGENMINPEKVRRVVEECNKHVLARKELFGSIIQPAPKDVE